MIKKPKILFFDIEPWYRVIVLSDGRVKIKSNHPRSKGRFLSQWYTRDGYLCCKLFSKTTTVHALIANLSYGSRPNGLVINHKDCNKLNNHPDNLEYCTIDANIQHAIKNGMHVSNDPKRSGRYIDGRATKDKIKEYKRQWYLLNRDSILEKAKINYWSK